MTKEALKLALQALESHIVWFSRDTMIGKSMREKTDKAIAAIKGAEHMNTCTSCEKIKLGNSVMQGCACQNSMQAPPAAQPAPVQEPVAWMVTWNEQATGNLFLHKQDAAIEMQRLDLLHPQDRHSVLNLYTTPPAAQPAPVQWNPKDHYNDGWKDAMNSIAAQPEQEPVAWSDAKQAQLNDWFLSLPEGKRTALMEDKWMLAGAAFLAGQSTQPAAQPVQRP